MVLAHFQATVQKVQPEHLQATVQEARYLKAEDLALRQLWLLKVLGLYRSLWPRLLSLQAM